MATIRPFCPRPMRSLEQLPRRVGFIWSRFVAAAANFGWLRAIRLYGWQAWQKNSSSFYVPDLGSRVHFRGWSDYHVLTLLFERNFYLDSGSFPLRTAIDLGANIGIETLRLATLHPGMQVVSIEADPDNFAVLAKNVENRPNVKAMNVAVWGESSRFSVKKAHNCNMGSMVELDPNGNVRGVTVSELIDGLGVTEVDVLKIDIEGAEASVFGPSIDQWIGRVRVIIWELNDHEVPGALTKLVNAMQRKGVAFNFHILGEKLIGIREDTPIRMRPLCGLLDGC